MDRYELVLGLPHTNHVGLAEHLLLMQAGHFQWTSIARAVGAPLSSLRTGSGQTVYATFYFIEERFPREAPIDRFQLDDRVSFAVFLRGFKGIAIEGKILFDHHDRLGGWLATNPSRLTEDDIDRHPYIRFANIFITPEAGNSRLKVAAPVARFSGMATLPDEENPYHLCKLAQQTGSLGLLEDGWRCVDLRSEFDVEHAIDEDRDTNGAGLVYFANYVAFVNTAEREAMRTNSQRRFSDAEIAGRIVQRRRMAYYGNVSPTGRIRTHVRLFQAGEDGVSVGARFAIRREEDDQLICLSESIKVLAG